MSNSGSADGWNEEKGELVLHLWHTNRREGEQKTLIWENVWDEMFIILISYFPHEEANEKWKLMKRCKYGEGIVPQDQFHAPAMWYESICGQEHLNFKKILNISI